MESLTLDVPDGPLAALRFGNGPRIAVAVHGITASAMSFRTVARHLPDDWSLVAVDLRGRGRSNELPGPYGMNRHAADVCAAVELLSPGQPVALVGQSMGAYVALRAAATRPDLFTRLVLVDGGLPLPVPADMDPDQVLAATLGPALTRLATTYPSTDSYVDFFRAHPALAGDWSEDIATYARYDATGPEGAVRSRVNGAAVSDDSRDLLVDGASFGPDLVALRIPTVLLYAPLGMFGTAPGLLPEPVVAHWRAQAPLLHTELVDACNHYTILMTDRPARMIVAHLTGDPESASAVRAEQESTTAG